MTSERNYQSGDQIDLGDGATITLSGRKGRNGIRWNWGVEGTDLFGHAYLATPEDAIADARKAMNTPACRHGETGWCPNCHDDNQ